MLVAAAFHLVRLANEALTQVRQRVLCEGSAESQDRPALTVRTRLLSGCERLCPAPFTRMWNSLIDTGDDKLQILKAHVVKE